MNFDVFPKGFRDGNSLLLNPGVSKIVPLLCHKVGIPSSKLLNIVTQIDPFVFFCDYLYAGADTGFRKGGPAGK